MNTGTEAQFWLTPTHTITNKSPEQMSALYVSAHHRYCMFQLYVSLGYIFDFTVWLRSAYALVRFRHKNHLVWVRIRLCFALKKKKTVLCTTNTARDVPRSPLKDPVTSHLQMLKLHLAIWQSDWHKHLTWTWHDDWTGLLYIWVHRWT